MAASGFEGLLTGHTLADRYHVDEVIGRGGFAAVYRATDQRLGRTVAVKVITQSASNPEIREEIQRRFEREARAIAMLHHPNVVTVFDFGADPALGLDFLVMELLRGEALSDRLRSAEPIAVPEALRILRDAAAGVDAGHRAGLIHRDIKPGNIFLALSDRGGPPRVVVVDFGIARFTEQDATQLTHSGRGFLSPAYASPEQLRGERPVTPAADVFSLGVIGYHLLAREKPYTHDRLHPGPHAHSPAPLRERNSAVPPAVAAVIEQAMRDDPAERFADAGAFVRALEEAETAAAEQGSAPVTPAAVLAPDSTHLQPPSEISLRAADTDPAVAPVASSDDPSAAAARVDRSSDDVASPEPAEASTDDPASVRADAAAVPVAPVAAVTPEPPLVSPPPAAADDRLREPPAPRPATGADDVRREPPIATRASAPPSTTPVRPARRRSPGLLAIPLLLVIAAGLWFALGRRGNNDRVAVAPDASHSDAAPSAGTSGGDRAARGSAGSASTGPGQTASGGGQTGAAGSTSASNDAEAPVGGIAREPETRPAAPSTAGRPPAAPPVTAPPVAAPPAVAPSSSPSATSPKPREHATESAPAARADAGGADAKALNGQGESLFDRGDVDGAIARFRAAVRAAPGNAYYRNNLGWALFRAGRIDEAGRELNEAVRLDPRRDIAYANIGEVERAKGNIAAAIAAYERFLELNTDPRREAIAREKLRRLRGG